MSTDCTDDTDSMGRREVESRSGWECVPQCFGAVGGPPLGTPVLPSVDSVKSVDSRKFVCLSRWMGVCIAGAMASVAVQAGVITEATRTYTVGYTLGDLVDPPMTFEQTVTDSTITSLTEVRVGLHLVGVSAGAGWASEIYVSLNRDLTATSVLLNGVGITTLDPVGFGYDGWNVTFRDGATAGDVHAVNLGSGVMVGEVEPDGRLDATDTARPSMLSVFVGGTGNGVWRLSVADLGVGGQMQLASWSLMLSGVSPVPETGMLGGVGVVVLGAMGLGWWRKKSFKFEV